jgi:phosphoribosylformylglycinamidine synthase
MLYPPPPGIPVHGWWFGEDQARYVIETEAILSVQLAALEAGVPIRHIGTVGGGALTLSGGNAISVAQLKAAHEAWLPGYMHQGRMDQD